MGLLQQANVSESEGEFTMKCVRETSVRCVCIALVLGIVADLMLRVRPWGLNVFVFAGCLAAGIAVLAPDRRKAWALPIAVYGAFFVWRDSPVLRGMNLVAMVTLAVTVALPQAVARISRTAFVQYVGAACDAVIGMSAGLSQSMHDILVRAWPGPATAEVRASWIRVGASGAIGLCIAFPLVFVFGTLFVSADLAFRTFVQHIFDAEWDTIIQHILTITVVAWLCGGFLHVAATDARVGFPLERSAAALRLESLSVFIPLTLLNGLFLIFVAVQFRYFFGDASLIVDPAGPTYSEYARQGFFQLVAVAVLALFVLYAGDWLQRDASAQARAWFRRLAGLLIALVYLVMASALHRMYLYYDAYGLTQLRFYTTAFMLLLGIVLVAFCSTVLWGNRDRFVMIALSLAWGAVVALHLVNPDSMIVRANTARALAGASFDAKYHGRLSADAAPALMRLTAIENAPVARERMKSKLSEQSTDWRTWNWSRHVARELLGSDK